MAVQCVTAYVKDAIPFRINGTSKEAQVTTCRTQLE